MSVCIWRYGIWGACYGAVLAELMLVLIIQIGAVSMADPVKLWWPSAMATVATAIWVTILWKHGDTRGSALLLISVYVLIITYVINRLTYVTII